ncbi:distal membrane-arm assembly complex protein 1 [Nerophis ophidion]|uniref:distal membrane-arm assembly complex protein 1 n=1 Tax=Nerophis ophidion TaxID=159077 RepID=UPI002ADFE734|nr:distal membrane-arm assembly complex protein 1 [Nerophis ophidion]
MATPEGEEMNDNATKTTKASTLMSLPDFKKCLSCRIISGGGLILAGFYVHNAARRVVGPNMPTPLGTVLQITFAACLAGWGVIVMVHPVGKMRRVDQK